MADIRNHMASSAGYDEKKRLREAIAKVQKAISKGRSEPPPPIRDPFVCVSGDKATFIGSESVHHAAQSPGPKQEPVVKGGKGKGKKGEKGGRAIVLPTLGRSQVKCQERIRQGR